MKFADRYPVEGPAPTIYIGRRIYKGKGGVSRASKRYYAEWCQDGRHRYEALGTPNKQVAIRRAHDICRRIDEGQTAPRAWKLSIEQLVSQYLQLKRDEGLAPKSLSKYENDLAHFRRWGAEAKVFSAVGFAATEFWRFSSWLTGQEYQPKTVYSRLVLVKQVFKWAWENKLLPEYTLLTSKLTEPLQSEQPCFTPEQVALLLEHADPLEAAIYATLAYAGLRIGEVRALKWRDVLLDVGAHGILVIRRGGSRNAPKNKKIRRIPIHARLRQYLLQLPRTHEHVFTARPSTRYPQGGRPISERRLLVALKRLCKRVGLENPEQYKLHTFRHTFASMCARNNVSYKYALTWMGHSSSEILDVYYEMYDDVAETAMSTIQYAPSQTREIAA